MVVAFPQLLLLTFACWQRGGAGLEREARDSAAKRLGVWLETAKAFNKCFQYSRVMFTGQL